MISDLLSNLSPAEYTDFKMMLEGYGHCENCWYGITKETVCDSCREEARQKENVRRYGNTPVMREWNPLERKPEEQLRYPYQDEVTSYSIERHLN